MQPKARGHKISIVNTLKCASDLQSGKPDLYYKGKPLTGYDAMAPRIGASITYFGTAVVRQFEQMNVFVTNSSGGISNSRDKLRSMQILSRHQFGMPRTKFVRDRNDVIPAIERIGGAPMNIKLLEATQGVGVILADQDINVLTLYRGKTVVPNSKASRTLEAGDRLLCFGKQESVKSMVPKKTQKKRQPKLQELDKEMVKHATGAPLHT